MYTLDQVLFNTRKHDVFIKNTGFRTILLYLYLYLILVLCLEYCIVVSEGVTLEASRVLKLIYHGLCQNCQTSDTRHVQFQPNRLRESRLTPVHWLEHAGV